MPLILALVLVVGAIGAIVLMTGGKSPPNTAPPPTVGGPTVTPTAPKSQTPPPPPPYPDLAPAKVLEIRAKVKEFEPLIKKGQALYDEALALKNSGKDKEWQAKLKEAVVPFETINDLWNEIESELPTNQHYDQMDVANHYLGDEGNKVTKAVSTLMAIKKQMRLSGD